MNDGLSLGDRLVQRGRITSEDLNKVRRLDAEQRKGLARLVLDLGFMSEDDLLPILSEHFEIPYISVDDYPVDSLPVDRLVSLVDYLKLARLAPLKLEGSALWVATTDPMDFARLHALQISTGLTIKPVLAKEKEIVDRLSRLFDSEVLETDAATSAGRDLDLVDEEDVDYLRDMASEVPVIRLVNQMIARALESRASDIHIEPFEERLKVRYRIDGILHEVDPPPRQFKAAVISRLKILAKLNIAERRLPQDGRIKTKIAGKDIDLRVATVPTLHGETVVIRILERSQVLADLGSLGFPEDVFGEFDEIIRRPHGMLLVTGPTGSGKTTTLYGALDKINDPGKKIITIEDPVEYQLPGINQIQVKPQIGLTFANGLRSIVRQDPDIIMVGEIRDFETAEIAIQAALTGHLVLSTLHTNDASGAVSRLLEMGVPDYLLASSLLGVLAQRLVRRLCLHCRRRVESDGVGEYPGSSPWEAVGCSACKGTGFVGRVGIFEYLCVNSEISRLIVEHADAGRIRNAGVGAGMRLLRQDGWQKVRDGITTAAEVLRVTTEED
jgi:general secretion pathway protein E